MAALQSMILDTCALLWLAGGNKKLSRSAAKRIDESPAVYVSAISGFEIGLKARKGRLKLPLAPKEWFERVLEHHDLTVLPLTLEICVAATELPAIHEDPCDRFIIAAARLNDFIVVTSDETFEKYGLTIIQ
jgi:PIN domain nuclease of toxin-antitoxin system